MGGGCVWGTESEGGLKPIFYLVFAVFYSLVVIPNAAYQLDIENMLGLPAPQVWLDLWFYANTAFVDQAFTTSYTLLADHLICICCACIINWGLNMYFLFSFLLLFSI